MGWGNYFFERASNSNDIANEKPSIKDSSASISDNSFIQSNTLSIREKVSLSTKGVSSSWSDVHFDNVLEYFEFSRIGF